MLHHLTDYKLIHTMYHTIDIKLNVHIVLSIRVSKLHIKYTRVILSGNVGHLEYTFTITNCSCMRYCWCCTIECHYRSRLWIRLKLYGSFYLLSCFQYYYFLYFCYLGCNYKYKKVLIIIWVP